MEISIGDPVAVKVLDSCVAVDNRRYYKIQWQPTWEAEEDVAVKYQPLLDEFWKGNRNEPETNEIEAGRTFIHTLLQKLNEPQIAEAAKIVEESASGEATETEYNIADFYKQVNSPEHKISDEPPPQKETNKPPPLLPCFRKGGEIRPFKCDECVRSYATEKKLKDHKRKLHANLGAYQCSICSKVFPTKRNLQNHVNRHTGVGPHPCPGCSKRFMTPQELDNHKRQCNSLVEKDYQCEICSKRFTTKTHLAFHRKIHVPDDEKPFKCSYCPRTFAYNHDCVHHMRLHVGEKPFKCAQCEAAFHRKSYLTEHMFVHTGVSKYRCEECLQYFKTQQMLQTHVKNIHILKKKPLTDEERQKKVKKNKKNIRYKCDECGREFRFMKEYHYHQVVNHKEAVQKKTENVEFTEFEPTMVYKCKKCDKTFVWPSTLKKHAETHKYDDLVDKYIEVVVETPGSSRKRKNSNKKQQDESPSENKENEDGKEIEVETSPHKVIFVVSNVKGDEQARDVSCQSNDSNCNTAMSENCIYTCGYCLSVFQGEEELNAHVLEKHQDQGLTVEELIEVVSEEDKVTTSAVKDGETVPTEEGDGNYLVEGVKADNREGEEIETVSFLFKLDTVKDTNPEHG